MCLFWFSQVKREFDWRRKCQTVSNGRQWASAHRQHLHKMCLGDVHVTSLSIQRKMNSDILSRITIWRECWSKHQIIMRFHFNFPCVVNNKVNRSFGADEQMQIRCKCKQISMQTEILRCIQPIIVSFLNSKRKVPNHINHIFMGSEVKFGISTANYRHIQIQVLTPKKLGECKTSCKTV